VFLDWKTIASPEVDFRLSFSSSRFRSVAFTFG